MMPVSAVFDNVPLTAVALKRGGYDWGFPYVCRWLWRLNDLSPPPPAWRLPYVPETKSAEHWRRRRWLDAVANIIGFFIVPSNLG